MADSAPTGLAALGIYLNDHLTGATGGVELAKRIASAHRTDAHSDTYARLATEIGEDRDALQRIMGVLGIRVNPVKVAAGWLGEKVGRFKLNGRLLGRSPLSDVIEVELMRLGVVGKAAGWRALRAVAEIDNRLDTTELDRLLDRAEQQSGDLEDLRIQAAATVFAAGPAHTV
jgi:hypothetical protein